MSSYDPKPGETDVPRSLAVQDFGELSEQLLRFVGTMTATTVLFVVSLYITVVLGLPIAFLALGVLVAGVVLTVGLALHVLPHAARFVFMLVRAPWFLPSTLLCAPIAALWQAGLLRPLRWESALLSEGFRRRFSLRARRYVGRVDERVFEVRQDLLQGQIVVQCAVDKALPAVYIAANQIAGRVAAVAPLVASAELREPDLLLRDGWLVIRQAEPPHRIALLAQQIARIESELRTDIVTELRTVSRLADWHSLRPNGRDFWPSYWFRSVTLDRYLYLARPWVKTQPPSVEAVCTALADENIREEAKAWLISLTLDRLSDREVRQLVALVPADRRDPLEALVYAPEWPAWVAIRQLAIHGRPTAVGALQSLLGHPTTPGDMRRAARQAIGRIAGRHGGLAALTGQVSMVDDDAGRLTVLEADGALSEVPKSAVDVVPTPRRG